MFENDREESLIERVHIWPTINQECILLMIFLRMKHISLHNHIIVRYNHVVFLSSTSLNSLHHHHRAGFEDLFGGFFFLNTSKSSLYSDLFTTIFLNSRTSRASRQIIECATKFDWDKSSLVILVEEMTICWFLNDELFGWFICRFADTVTLKLKLAHAVHLAIVTCPVNKYRVWFAAWSQDC